jgi:3-hydroxyacyl-[acyl-carrier-protein] dehydratase
MSVSTLPALPVEASALVPQRPPMLAIDRLTVFEEDVGGTVESFIRPDSPLVDADGSVEATLFVELIAQSFAAVKGYEDAKKGKGVAKGFLVEAKRFEVFGTARAGETLSVIIRKTGETEEFALAEGTVMREETVLASGSVMVWVPQETK